MRGLRRKYKKRTVLTARDIRIYRTLYVIAMILIPIFAFVWSNYQTGLLMNRLIATVFTIFFLIIYIFSYRYEYIRNRIDMFLYYSYFIISGFVVFISYHYQLSRGYPLMLLMAVFYIMLTFIRLKHLIIYIAFTLGTVTILSAIALNHSTDSNYIIVPVSIAVLSTFAVFSLSLRIGFQKDLQESYTDMQRLLDSSPDGIIVHENRKILYANPVFLSYFHRKILKDINFLSVYDLVDKSEFDELEARIRSLQENSVDVFEKKIKLTNQKIYDFEIINSITTFQGKKAIMTTCKDVTKRKQMEQELTEAEYKYRSLVEGSLAGVFIYQKGNVIYVNPYIESLFGFKAAEIYNMNFFDLIFPEDQELLKKTLKDFEEGKEPSVKEIRTIHKNGDILTVQFQITNSFFRGLPAMIGTMVDITSQKAAESQINYLAYHDTLTGLVNRNYLKNFLKESKGKYSDTKMRIAVMFIDLDKFKFVNDTMGHNFGDMLLIQASHRLKQSLREEDLIARYGGDEFVIILRNVNEKEAKEFADKILDKFSAPFLITDQSIQITPSIGIYVGTADEMPIEAMIKNADLAMYYSKEQNRNTYTFYTRNISLEVFRNYRLEKDLKNCLEDRELELYFQPQLDPVSKKPVACDTITYWHHHELGLIEYPELLAQLKKSSMIVPVSYWAIKEAIKTAVLWNKQGVNLTVSIDVPIEVLKDGHFESNLKTWLKEMDCKSESIELKINAHDVNQAAEVISVVKQLKAIGIKVAIDHFEGGFHSAWLVKEAKIDRVWVDSKLFDLIATADIGDNFLKLSDQLGFQIVVFCIENEKQAPIASYISRIQGNYYSKPLSMTEFQFYIEKHAS